METLKTENQIYDEVKNFIEKCTSLEKLKDMLIETIDNTQGQYYKELYIDHIQSKVNTIEKEDAIEKKMDINDILRKK